MRAVSDGVSAAAQGTKSIPASKSNTRVFMEPPPSTRVYHRRRLRTAEQVDAAGIVGVGRLARFRQDAQAARLGHGEALARVAVAGEELPTIAKHQVQN